MSPVDDPGSARSRRVTVNQTIARNITLFRKAAGMSQAEFGKRMGGWSGASVSAAERSWDGKRIRKFDADEIVEIAAVLGVPVGAMFLPPADAETETDYTFALQSPDATMEHAQEQAGRMRVLERERREQLAARLTRDLERIIRDLRSDD